MPKKPKASYKKLRNILRNNVPKSISYGRTAQEYFGLAQRMNVKKK